MELPVIKAGVFNFPPFAYECQEGYCGVEVKLLNTAASALGRRVAFSSPAPVWGTVYANGTADGLVGAVVSGAVDVAAAEFFNMPIRNALADPSDFYHHDHFCYLLARPGRGPEWLQLVRPFSPKVWMAAATCVLATCAFLALRSVLGGKFRLLQGLVFYLGQPTTMNLRYVNFRLSVTYI